jgi:hypothetical protein
MPDFLTIYLGVTIVAHVILAIAVLRIARQARARDHLVLARPLVWAGMTLIGGLLVAVPCWVVHRPRSGAGA